MNLFAVLSYEGDAPYCVSVLQLETPPPVNNHESVAAAPKRIKRRLLVDQLDKSLVARFTVPPGACPPTKWLFSPPTISNDNLYLVPYWDPCYTAGLIPKKPPPEGYKFNFGTGVCRPIKAPRASKNLGHVVNRREGHIYFMADPNSYFQTPDPVFESYDPDTNKWKALEPFPDHAVHLRPCSIKATAVLDDTILYNMGSIRIWAYNVPNDKWYIVHVEDDRCYDILGEAVVLENTIYALTDPFYSPDSVLALSIEREEIDGDLLFKCSLRSVILVQGMDQINCNGDAHTMTRHLVHLGKDNFCLVQSYQLGNYFGLTSKKKNYFGLDRYQHIQLTSIKRNGENSMTVTNICLYEVEIQCDKQFEVRLCFSLPKCQTTALNEGQRFLYNLDPHRLRLHLRHIVAYALEHEDKTDFNPEPEVEKPDGAASGHSIYVRSLHLIAA